MKLKNKIFIRCGSLVASLALLIGVSTTNSACIFWLHQPEEPEEMKKYKK
ncbi:MAG: cyclic lactone autoinducer peptide [Eubacteriaceae bacterium]